MAHRTNQQAVAPGQQIVALIAVKLLHTAVWIFFVACIVAIPVAGWLDRYGWAAACSACVLVECAVIALNRGRCPLTEMAAQFTDDRQANFDIYLPLWLAENNKTVFGAIFLGVEFFVLGRWVAIAFSQ